MRLFYKTKGTISVFLCLILLPTILVGAMTVDASRIYMSKVVISDAGEMAMNAGLAQYNEILHDKYGLLVMDQTPEAMSSELEGYFNESLNGMGISGAEDYDKILDLLTKNFQAVSVAGSEICRTEVEKQQIIEYMKYRAPVCLTELVIKKIAELKDTQKMMDAMAAEGDFSEAMQDCQDEFQKALEALDALNQAVENFPSDKTVRRELENAKSDFTGTMARCLLMREVIQDYDERSQSTDLEAMVRSYVECAGKVNLSSPYSEQSFSQYINCCYYENTISHLGGANKLLTDYDKAKQEQEEAEKLLEEELGSGTEEQVQEEPSVDTAREELQTLVNDYSSKKGTLAGYLNALLNTANNLVITHHAALNSYLNTAKTAEQSAKTAYDRLKDVKKKLENAKKKFQVWDESNQALKSVGKSGDMDSQVEEYRSFFSSGDGASDLQKLEELIADVENDQNYFGEWKNVLENQKFFGKSIASVQTDNQMNKYISEADKAAAGIAANDSSVERARGSYAANYSGKEFSGAFSKKSIKNNEFYKKLQEYCREGNGNGSQQEQSKAKDKLNESKSAGDLAALTEGFPDFDWGSAGVALPSSLVGVSAENPDKKLTDLDGGTEVNKSSGRSNIISQFMDSMKAASSFLDGVDRIVADMAENLYVAEYAMQMFSYYTVDKEKGAQKPEADIISLSGYDFRDRAAYKSETEYILWGNSSSQANVRNTFMLIFGIRLLFNSFYAFTDSTINATATAAATAIAVAAPYLVPALKIVIKLGYAGVETANDIVKLKQGYGVTIVKSSSTWATLNNGDNTSGLTFDYSEYLRLFLNVYMLGNSSAILGRIADCIQVDEPGADLRSSYTMLAIQAKVSTRTTFMRKISDFGGDGSWGFPDDTYTISYQSILGY